MAEKPPSRMPSLRSMSGNWLLSETFNADGWLKHKGNPWPVRWHGAPGYLPRSS